MAGQELENAWASAGEASLIKDCDPPVSVG